MPTYYNTPRTRPQFQVPGTQYNAAGQAYDPRYATDSTAGDNARLAQAADWRRSIGYDGNWTRPQVNQQTAGGGASPLLSNPRGQTATNMPGGGAIASVLGSMGGAGGSQYINPGPIYTPQQTNEATNAAVAGAQQQANMPWMISQQTPVGQSVRSPSATARVLPDYAGALAGGAEAAQTLPFADALANAQHLLGGESAVENELLDWQGINRSLSNTNRGASLQRFGAIMSALTNLMGGM